MQQPPSRPGPKDVLRLLLPVVGLVVAGAVASNFVIQSDGPFWLATILLLVPLLAGQALLQRAKRH